MRMIVKENSRTNRFTFVKNAIIEFSFNSMQLLLRFNWGIINVNRVYHCVLEAMRVLQIVHLEFRQILTIRVCATAMLVTLSSIILLCSINFTLFKFFFLKQRNIVIGRLDLINFMYDFNDLRRILDNLCIQLCLENLDLILQVLIFLN